ncbi:MAG: bifunctional nuclease family protein [Saprospiraceae bacterium]|nr:bifunctional nuclease family protein [Saprospiraceae bacterium]
MKKVELEIIALSHSMTQTHSYAVVLGEVNGARRLPIVIGGFEAQSIAVAMEDMPRARPLSHDLFKDVLDTHKVDIKEVIINDLKDGIFYSLLKTVKDGEEVEIDSRTSDALALAVRYKCPIFTYSSILETAGIFIEDEDEDAPLDASPEEVPVEASAGDDYETMPLKDLEKLLQQLLENEEYEKAAALRDVIKRRKA